MTTGSSSVSILEDRHCMPQMESDEICNLDAYLSVAMHLYKLC